jgi:branched-chain amino acid transport system permease protein
MRAVADDQQAALAQGISVRRIFALAWALAAVSALLGGVLLADIAEVSQNLANFGLIVFPVVILGGLDSMALVLILLVRPYGLFGQVRIERV